MPVIGFVGSLAMSGMDPDDARAAAALEAAGWEVDYLCWDDPGADWTRCDAYINRCTWGYQHDHAAFTAWLDRCANGNAPLFNAPAIQTWNSTKAYLPVLAARGYDVVPTWIVGRDDLPALGQGLQTRGWSGDVVFKPCIGASGFDTIRCPADAIGAHTDAMTAIMDKMPGQRIVIQPFMPEIETAGEWSFVFFNGAFSHALLKKPGQGDFRWQQRWGGRSALATPPATLIRRASRFLKAVEGPLLYARIDGFARGDRFILIELELCEPYLWFGVDPNAPARFAAAFGQLWHAQTMRHAS